MTLDRGDSPLAGRRPAPLSSVAGLGAMNTLNPISAVGSVHAPSSATSLGSLGQISSLGSMGSTSVNTASASPHQASSAVATDSRNSASFWLELKGVERWFDKLEPHERMTLMTSLFARSPEAQLHQFSSTIDKALRNQATTNLSRFGVRHNHNPATANDIYKYRSPLSVGSSTAGPSGGVQGSGPTAPGSTGSPSISQNANGSIGKSKPTAIPGTTGQQSVPTTVPNAAVTGSGASSVTSRTGSSGPAGTGHSSHTTEATSSGFMSPLTFPSSSSHASDLYTQAFLPLPRSQGYSPWGKEIRRPNSAAADAWPDAARNSPILQSVSNTGSPKISSLSLETPPPFSASSVNANSAGVSSAQSPIGHPLKPWRTFTPHQNPIGSGVEPPPDSATTLRPTTTASQSSPSSPPSYLSGPIGSNPLSSSNVSLDNAQGRINAGATNVSGQGDNPNNSSSTSNPLSKSNAQSANPNNTSAGLAGNEPRSSSQGPRDNRLARRSVNVADAELLSDIGAWLRSLRLHKYTGNLSGMRWQDVIQLTDKDLEERGVNALGARRKLLKMFEEIRAAQEAGQLPDR